MSEEHSKPGSRRARPVAELALEPLLEAVGELSRRWAIALIADGPLESLGGLPLEDLAREAPELIGQVIRALRSEEGLELLLNGGPGSRPSAARIAPLTGAGEPASVVAAVEALRGVLWEALVDEFGSFAPKAVRARQLTDLADRLAYLSAMILPAAFEGIQDTRQAVAPAEPPAGESAHSPRPRPSRPVRSGAVIVDDLAPPVAPAGPEELVDPERRAQDGAIVEPALGTQIQIRDERGDEGPAAWIRSIGRQLERFEDDGISFAVALVELRGENSQPADNAWAAVEEQLAEELRAGGGGAMTRERAGRYWLLAPATDRLGAGRLAERLSRALEAPVRSRPPALSVAVGTAVCPEDGRRASALAAHADVGLFAARSERSLAAPPRAARRSERAWPRSAGGGAAGYDGDLAAWPAGRAGECSR